MKHIKKGNIPELSLLFLTIIISLFLTFFNSKLFSPKKSDTSDTQKVGSNTNISRNHSEETSVEEDVKSGITLNMVESVFLKMKEVFGEKSDNEQEEQANENPTIANTPPSSVENNRPTQPAPSEPLPPPPPSCPQTTLACVPCLPGEQYCRYEQGAESGYLGWACQNNNPSNIRYSSYRANLITQMGGTAPCGEKGGFMVFSTYEVGKNSVKAYIRAINAGLHTAYRTSEFTCGDCTLTQLFSKYAPDSTTYDDQVAQKMGGGVTVDTKLNWIVDNRLNDFVEAIQCMEGYFIYSGGVSVKWCNL